MVTTVISGETISVNDARIRLTIQPGGMVSVECLTASVVEVIDEQEEQEDTGERNRPHNRLHDFLN